MTARRQNTDFDRILKVAAATIAASGLCSGVASARAVTDRGVTRSTTEATVYAACGNGGLGENVVVTTTTRLVEQQAVGPNGQEIHDVLVAQSSGVGVESGDKYHFSMIQSSGVRDPYDVRENVTNVVRYRGVEQGTGTVVSLSETAHYVIGPDGQVQVSFDNARADCAAIP